MERVTNAIKLCWMALAYYFISIILIMLSPTVALWWLYLNLLVVSLRLYKLYKIKNNALLYLTELEKFIKDKS